MVMRRRGCAVEREGWQLWWIAKRAMSPFADKGRVLGEEERSREAVYMRQREAELLEKLRKQGEKLEEIKRALAEYKDGHAEIQDWLHDTKLDKQEQS
ncbi:hypothetical protein GOP47_0010354 [Adiantum capillus-veneris]|uniref:Uncharacterized protein n=1 Tax=Adiantum capillus-veneris TaxID=13818 RepID=A0A9D4ZG85_ADICA|nr:hypothetical protein GOP47_0010354 [Adiantum capillus-veneris]